MSSLNYLLLVPGVRELIQEYLIDPSKWFYFHQFDPPSFYRACPHILGERICRKLLSERAKDRLTSWIMTRHQLVDESSLGYWFPISYNGEDNWGRPLRDVRKALVDHRLESLRYIRHRRRGCRERAHGPWTWMHVSEVQSRIASLKRKR